METEKALKKKVMQKMKNPSNPAELNLIFSHESHDLFLFKPNNIYIDGNIILMSKHGSSIISRFAKE